MKTNIFTPFKNLNTFRRRYVLILILPFLIGCFSSTTSKKATATEQKTKDLPDCSTERFRYVSQEEIDSVSNDPRRSNETIKSLFPRIKPELLTFLQDKDSLFNKKDSFYVMIQVTCKGKLSPVISDEIHLDSLTKADLVSTLEPYKLDSIENCLVDVIFGITFYKTDNGLTCFMGKGVNYYQSRSKAAIMQVVMQNLASLRYAYNRRLREKPGIQGKIYVKYRIDENGDVISSKVVKSSMHDRKLENTIAKKIKTWKHCPINKSGDITEVVYPFVFSQD